MLRVDDVLVPAVLHSLFFVFFQSAVQEAHECGNVFLVAERAGDRITLSIHSHIEWLGVGAKLATLQVAPLVAHSAQRALLSALGHFHRLWQRCLVVHEE